MFARFLSKIEKYVNLSVSPDMCFSSDRWVVDSSVEVLYFLSVKFQHTEFKVLAYPKELGSVYDAYTHRECLGFLPTDCWSVWHDDDGTSRW